MDSGLQIEQVGFSLLVRQSLPVPVFIVVKPVQLQFLKGNASVYSDPAVGRYAAGGCLSYLEANGIEPALRHLDLPGHALISCPPAIASHRIQQTGGQTVGLRVGIHIALPAHHGIIPPGAVLRLKLHTYTACLSVTPGLIFLQHPGIGRNILRRADRHVSDPHRLVDLLQRQGMLPLFQIKKQRIFKIPLSVLKIGMLPDHILRLNGPDLVSDTVYRHFSLPEDPVKAHSRRFLKGQLSVDQNLPLNLRPIAVQRNIIHGNPVQASLIHPEAPFHRVLLFPGIDHLSAVFITLRLHQNGIPGQHRLSRRKTDPVGACLIPADRIGFPGLCVAIAFRVGRDPANLLRIFLFLCHRSVPCPPYHYCRHCCDGQDARRQKMVFFRHAPTSCRQLSANSNFH